MAKVYKAPKPRNEFVSSLIARAGSGGGAHGKPYKVDRRNEKIALKKEYA